jgi:hypothetical protein
MTEPRCLYFGCWNGPGHHLVGPGGDRQTLLSNDAAWSLECKLDGCFAPKRKRGGELAWGHADPDVRPYDYELSYAAEYPQGQFLRHKLDGFTLIQWWDRCQGDTRGACNSTILLEGEHTTEEMLAALAQHFPHVLENLKRHGVELVEVKAPTATGAGS